MFVPTIDDEGIIICFCSFVFVTRTLPNELWIGERNEANRLLLKDPSLLGPKARTYASLPGGHVEGYADTHKNVYRAFYRKVADASAAVEYPTFNDGLLGMKLLEKIIESDKKRCWVDTGL